MITLEKIKIYKRYSGDIDSWAKSGSKKEKLFINDDDWHAIDGLIQDFYLMKNGLTSLKFNSDLNNKLMENCDSETTIEALKKFS